MKCSHRESKKKERLNADLRAMISCSRSFPSRHDTFNNSLTWIVIFLRAQFCEIKIAFADAESCFNKMCVILTQF